MSVRSACWLRLTSLLGAALALQAALYSAAAFAQDVACVAGESLTCPAPVPRLETPLGHSLYWHDPCGGGYHPYEYPCFTHRSTHPTWFAQAEFMPLFRDESDSLGAAPLAPGGELALGTDHLDPEFQGGTRILLGRSLGDWYRLEGSWMGSYRWTDSISVQDAGETASIRFDTKMNGAELNLRRRLCVDPGRYCIWEASWLVGARYMGIKEDLDYAAAAGNATGTESVRADNDLFGLQIGGLSQFLVHDRAWIDFDIKGVMFSNEASIDSQYQDSTGGRFGFVGEEDRTAFMGDLSLILNYQFAPAWTFRIGYNAMWLTGVALASQNVTTAETPTPIYLDHSGDVVYHGPSIGLVWAR